jgi:hypothetical protein
MAWKENSSSKRKKKRALCNSDGVWEALLQAPHTQNAAVQIGHTRDNSYVWCRIFVFKMPCNRRNARGARARQSILRGSAPVARAAA